MIWSGIFKVVARRSELLNLIHSDLDAMEDYLKT